MRILIVLEYFPPHIGGVETLFDHVTAALVCEGHQVTVITLRVPGTKRREIRHGVEVLRVWTPRWARRGFFTLVSFPLALQKALHADIVHAATPNAALPAWLSATIARKPVVHTVHEVFADLLSTLPGLHPLRALLFRLFETSVLRLPFAQFLCVSEFTRGRLVRLMHIAPERTAVIYPALEYAFWDRTLHQPRDLKGELGLGGDVFLSLYFGRPGFLKGVEYLIDAAALIRERLPSSHLVLLLDHDPPDQYQRLRQRIVQLGLTEYITVRDPVARDALPSYLLAADCVIVPSLSEGFGYAAVEAATLGCPVVTTSGHSVQEVIGDYADFVPPRDATALAAAVVAVARSPHSRMAPQRFTLAAHVAALTDAYARLAPGQASARPHAASLRDR
ncbi:MAG: glycosyltransferase family 4 protein [Chloroflexota bacterium]|nr:glycosyltransferase family 4 protein [Chloroflexota bacterium]